MTASCTWQGYGAFHAAKKAAREAGLPEPTRAEFLAQNARNPTRAEIAQVGAAA